MLAFAGRGVVLKDHLSSRIDHSRILFACFITFMILIVSSGCAKSNHSNSVILMVDDHSFYHQVAADILPTFFVEQSDSNLYQNLKNGSVAEAFDAQAAGAIEIGIAKEWYPQYLATVIIAVDRDQTDAPITQWSDLVATDEEVSFLSESKNAQMLIAAMSYGLEGERYSVQPAIALLKSLQETGHLKMNSTRSALIICYDYQAANLIKNGRNLEIIVPIEGTLTFEKGLLAPSTLVFNGDVDSILLNHSFRLTTGQSEGILYPDPGAYGPAVKVADYQHFSAATNNVKSLLERTVLNTKWLMSIDDQEHLHFALIYMIIITVWVASFLRRSMQRGVTFAALVTGVLLNGWTLVRLIKYQAMGTSLLNRYLWYAFYIFLLFLPLVLLWMAWAIDQPEQEILPPRWWRGLVILASGLIILVFTNDLHGLVFQLDLSRSDWGVNYSYGIGYYLILLVSMSNLLAMTIILLVKSLKNPRKKAFVFPVTIFIIFAVYNYKYILRDPFVYQTDLTIVIGLFTLLMFEVCIRSGLIPVNTNHNKLFRRSPLKLQIINKAGEVALTSASASALNERTRDQVLASAPISIVQPDDSILFATPIPGGVAISQEDVSMLVQLQREIQESTNILTKANTILMKEEKINRSINEANERKQLMDQLESEIAQGIQRLTASIENLPKVDDHSMETTRIALLLCYLKRRCNLFFQEKEETSVPAEGIAQYIDELIEIAKYSNVQVAGLNKINGRIKIRPGTIMYDFFYGVIDWAVQTGCPYLIEHLVYEDEELTMRILPSGDIETFQPEPELLAALASAQGKIVTKDLDDTIGISISFTNGVNAYD